MVRRMTLPDSNRRRILVIDDDRELCALVTRFMADEGFVIECETDGRTGVQRALSNDVQLVMLDVMMPELSGFDVLRRIRAESRIPVLMLTARGDTLDRVLGLEMGADDYLAKPFDPSELAARIRAILRRANTPPAAAGTMAAAGIELEPSTRSARCDRRRVELTTVEFDLLMALVRAAGRAVAREELVSGVLGRPFSALTRPLRPSTGLNGAPTRER